MVTTRAYGKAEVVLIWPCCGSEGPTHSLGRAPSPEDPHFNGQTDLEGLMMPTQAYWASGLCLAELMPREQGR